VQTPVLQSLPAPQARPGAQSGHVGPPQSVSVSAPFLTPSVQLEAWQTPLAQTPVVQSPPALHDEPMPQRGQVPPQSVSVSVPFWTPSLQLGVRQSESVPHTPLRQS
jgi:hypothetical protein